MSRTQCDRILKHIRDAGHITVRQAMQDYSIHALPRRICDLQEDGFRFVRENARHPVTGQRYVRYKFAKDSPRTREQARLVQAHGSAA